MYFADDNSQVSEQGTFANPVAFTLRADLEESDEVRLYAECDTDFEATGVTVEGEGASVARWELAPDVGGSPGAYQAAATPLSLGTVGAGAENRVFFWARASAVDTEEIGVDNSVTLKLEGVGAAA